MYKNYRGDMKLKVAANKLGISERTLIRYETEEVPVPCEIVIQMSKIYKNPKILPDHCSLKCEIGQIIYQYLDQHELGVSVLRLIKELDDVVKNKNRLIEIAYDGKIERHELPVWIQIHKELRELKKAIAELEQVVAFEEIYGLMLDTKKEPVLATQAL